MEAAALIEVPDIVVAEVARDALERFDNPNPHEVAAETFDALPESVKRDIARAGWDGYICALTRRMRNHAPRAASEDSKVARIAAARDVMRLRVNIQPGVWKFLGDCGRPDLQALEASHEEIAAANHAVAERYRRLERERAKRKAATVSELDAGLVEEILYA